MPNSHRHFYEFDCFRIDIDERVLLREGVPVTLPPKVFETLLALVERHGHIVEKNDLIEQVWPDTVVEENNLSQCISAIRRTLGDHRRGPRYIETVPRRGYRFAGEVREVWGEEETVSITKAKLSLRIQEEIESPDVALVRQSAWQMSPRTRVIIATAAALVLVAVVIVASTVRRNSAIRVRPQIKSLAVLPLKSGSGDDQFVGLGITDDLISRFGQSIDLKIRPTASIYKYLAKERDAIAAGRELNVDAVFDGEVQKSRERLTINIRLLNTSDGALLWETKQESDVKDSVRMRDAIVDMVAREVFAVPASSLKRALAKQTTASAAAQEAYAKGRYYWNNRTPEGLHKSIALFEQAITHDPNFALAHAGLADAYAFDHLDWHKAESAARKSLELDGSLGQAHATIGFVRWFWLWDWDEAEREYKLAIALSPDYATSHQWYGVFLASRQYSREAKTELQRAIELDPFSLPINADLAQVLYFMGDFDGAIQQCQHSLAMDQNFVNAHSYLYQAYTMKGSYDEAVAEYFKVQDLIVRNPSFNREAEKALRAAYAKDGIRGFWREKLRVDEPTPDKIKDPYQRAEYFALLGEKEQALSALALAIDKRDHPALFTRVDPMLRSLIEDSRYDALMQQVDNQPQKYRLIRKSRVDGN